MLLFGSVLLLGCDNSNDDPPPPDTSHVKVFLSNIAYRPGDLGGLGGADIKCSDAAHLQGNTGDWTAWLSDNTADAVDRIFDSGGRPYQTIDGTIIANNLADLTDGTLDAPINIDQGGNPVTNELEVWSATGADGKYSGQGTCVNWATSTPGCLCGCAVREDMFI